MQKIVTVLSLLLLLAACRQKQTTRHPLTLHDGFYEVVGSGSSEPDVTKTLQGQVVINFDTLFSPGDYSWVAIDTNDFVPLKLDTDPQVIQQNGQRMLLSVRLTSGAAQKMKKFSSERVMKQVAIVIDGKAITVHKIREAITGNDIQITRCDDNACEYLYLKLTDGNH